MIYAVFMYVLMVTAINVFLVRDEDLSRKDRGKYQLLALIWPIVLVFIMYVMIEEIRKGK